MSDIDRTRMIPLHIADQAVAACDAEIAKLREENARLKAEVEELKSQPDPLTAYLYAAELGKDDRKKLKDEVKRLTWLQAETIDERNKAEAQVERLTKAGDAMASTLKDGGIIISGYALADEWFKAKCLASKKGNSQS